MIRPYVEIFNKDVEFKTYRTMPTTDVTKYASISEEELVEMEGEPDEIIEIEGTTGYYYYGDSREDFGDSKEQSDTVVDKNDFDFNNDDAVSCFLFEGGECIHYSYTDMDYINAEFGSEEDKMAFLEDLGIVPEENIVESSKDYSQSVPTEISYSNVNNEISLVGVSGGRYYVEYKHNQEIK